MRIDELKEYVRTMLNAAFPTVTIRFEKIGDDPFHIGVGVYGVESQAVRWVKDKILDIDEKLCANTDFAITPLVRDEATTEKHYPELMSPWKPWVGVTGEAILIQSQVSIGACEIWTDAVVGGFAAQWEYPESVCAEAANEELALAA
jgi:hypothetical protein